MKSWKAFAAAIAATATVAYAADWPDHPVKWIVPFAPGGANDLIGRAGAEGVSKVGHGGILAG